MLSNNGARCNDLGGDSSEEDNEKQNDSAGASSPAPLATSRGSASAEATSDEEDAAKPLYHPVVVSTLLNIDLENYMVHESQNGAAAKQRSPAAGCAPLHFHEPHREFFIVERASRPRSASLTDNIECFGARRDGFRIPVNRSNDDLWAGRMARMALNADLFTVTESVNSAAPAVRAPRSALAQRSCESHRRWESSRGSAAPVAARGAMPSAPSLVSTCSPLAAGGPGVAGSGTVHVAENGVVPAMAAYSFNCARTASFHALLCWCQPSCCCMCDFLCSAECYTCLHGVCSPSVARYPCTRPRILRPVDIAAADKVSLICARVILKNLFNR